MSTNKCLIVSQMRDTTATKANCPGFYDTKSKTCYYARAQCVTGDKAKCDAYNQWVQKRAASNPNMKSEVKYATCPNVTY